MSALAGNLQTAAAVTPIAALLMLAIVLAKVWPVLRKIKAEGDASLRGDLIERITKLESEVAAERQVNIAQRVECDERIERHEQRHSDEMQKLHAELRVLRHEKNNQEQRFNALLMLLKQDPRKVRESIAAIEELSARQQQVIATEKGAILGNSNGC